MTANKQESLRGRLRARQGFSLAVALRVQVLRVLNIWWQEMLFELALNNTKPCTATAPARWGSLLRAWLPGGAPTYQHGLHWGHE